MAGLFRLAEGPEDGVERQAAAGTDLLVTVDCGITAVDEVARARALGIEVVVTDHHRPGERLPECTVVHPAGGDGSGRSPISKALSGSFASSRAA